MKKGIKIFTSSADTVGERFPLNSMIIVIANSDHRIGTLIDKTGITPATTAQDLLDSSTSVEWLSYIAQLTYRHELSSLQIRL